ncbi:MAG TPA: hypothetical protein VJR23_15700, partial [Candidatus Acidoferrales bacterium]|nr:hypothetical protein [Candidatus Acidoferrales bacterium]
GRRSEPARFGLRRRRHTIAVELQEQRFNAPLTLRVLLNLVDGEIFARGVPLFHQQQLKLGEKFGWSAHICTIRHSVRNYGAEGHEML